MASRPVTVLAAASAPRRAARAVAPLQKGLQTRAVILAAALAQASRTGLEGLSIGALADMTGMSKSGVFAHFGSREDLQIAVVAEYHARFEQDVFFPALREPRGLPRLRALFERWVRQVSVELESGCIYISGAVEFDDRPGPGARRPGHHGQGLACRAAARHRAGARGRASDARDRCAATAF
jgi:AcrR family transcriptional regulator